MSEVVSPTPYVENVPDAVQELQEKFLLQPREEERVRILLELGRLGSQRVDNGFPFREVVARTLVELYNLSVWWPERRALLRAMGECRGSVVIFRYLLRMLDTVDLFEGSRNEGAELVTAIIDAFGRIGLPAIGPVLIRRYLSPEVPDQVRLQALEVLGHLGFVEAEESIVQAVDSGGEGRIVGVYALTELVSNAGVKEVNQILQDAWTRGELEWDHDRELVRAAITYLCTLGVPEAQAWVTRLLYTHEPDLRSLALWGRYIWGRNSKEDLLDLITAALDEEDDYIRASLGRNLRTYDAEEIIETGEVFCDTEQGQIRLIQILAEVGGDVVEQWLWERFLRASSSCNVVRVAAIRALRHLSKEESEELLEMACNSCPKVAIAAIRTAANFGPLEAIPSMMTLLEQEDPLLRQEGVRAIQHILLAHRPSHVSLRENKGQLEGHKPENMPVADEVMELIDTGFRKILRRDDDGTTQALVAYAAANLRREDLWPRVLKLAEKSKDVFARVASYHALLDMPDTEQVPRLMKAFAGENNRLARSACIRTLAPLLASLPKPDQVLEEQLSKAIEEAIGDADQFELVTYAHSLGLMRSVDPLPVLDKIASRGGNRSSLEVVSALGKLRRVGLEKILIRLDRVLAEGDPDPRIRAVDALAGLSQRDSTDRLLDLLTPRTLEDVVTTRAVRALASLGRSRRGLTFSSERLDSALERVDHLLREEKSRFTNNATTLQEDLMDLKLALWQATSTSGVDDERVERVITEQLGERKDALSRYMEEADEVFRALRGAEFFHLQSREMPASADLSPAILSYTKGIELWLDVRLKSLLGDLRDTAREQYPTIMEKWEEYEVYCRQLVTIPVEDANRAVDWTKVPRVAKAMKEKKFTADWRTLSISNSGAIVIFYGVNMTQFGARNALNLKGDPDKILSVAVNALALAALRNAMAHEQSASRQDLEACRNLAYDIMRGIADWG